MEKNGLNLGAQMLKFLMNNKPWIFFFWSHMIEAFWKTANSKVKGMCKFTFLLIFVEDDNITPKRNCLSWQFWSYFKEKNAYLPKKVIVCENKIIFKRIFSLSISNRKVNHLAKCLCCMTINILLKQIFVYLWILKSCNLLSLQFLKDFSQFSVF